MGLALRFVRAAFAFGLILIDYLVQRGLIKLVAPRRLDPASGRRRRRIPPWLSARAERLHRRNAARTLRTMLSLRGVYIKLGQVLSIMGGFLPREYTQQLAVLQDQVPARPFREVEAVLVRELGRPVAQSFASIEEKPIAAASLGQVHVAHLKDGTKVAVKVLYPKIRDVIRIDMIIVRAGLSVYRWFVPVDSIENAYHALVDLLHRETDYLHEADCMQRMSDNFSGDPDILFPHVHAELTTRDVLTMTFMDGVKITDFSSLDALGLSRREVATRLVQSFYKQLLIHRFFHADPHPGNFLVQRGGDGQPQLVVLDFGAICEARDELIDGLIEVLQGLFTEDSDKLVSGFLRMGFVAEGADREALGELTRTYFGKLMRFKDRSPAGILREGPRELVRELAPDADFEQLRELTKSVHYPDTWFYVERAVLLLFWLSATIDPDLDTVKVGFPYVMPLLMEKNRKDAEARRARRKQERQEKVRAGTLRA